MRRERAPRPAQGALSRPVDSLDPSTAEDLAHFTAEERARRYPGPIGRVVGRTDQAASPKALIGSAKKEHPHRLRGPHSWLCEP